MLQFVDGAKSEELKLDGSETYDILGLDQEFAVR